MTLPPRAGLVRTSGLVLLTLAGLASFLYGFLPLKPFLGGFAPAPEGTAPPAFDRLVFMLVDGLRRLVRFLIGRQRMIRSYRITHTDAEVSPATATSHSDPARR